MFQTNVKVADGFATEEALTVALPVESFLQRISVMSSIEITASQSLKQSIATLCSKTQSFASVMVTVCVPTGKLIAVCVVWLPALAPHWYVYGAVPPEGVAVASPFVQRPETVAFTFVI